MYEPFYQYPWHMMLWMIYYDVFYHIYHSVLYYYGRQLFDLSQGDLRKASETELIWWLHYKCMKNYF